MARLRSIFITASKCTYKAQFLSWAYAAGVWRASAFMHKFALYAIAAWEKTRGLKLLQTKYAVLAKGAKSWLLSLSISCSLYNELTETLGEKKKEKKKTSSIWELAVCAEGAHNLFWEDKKTLFCWSRSCFRLPVQVRTRSLHLLKRCCFVRIARDNIISTGLCTPTRSRRFFFRSDWLKGQMMLTVQQKKSSKTRMATLK